MRVGTVSAVKFPCKVLSSHFCLKPVQVGSALQHTTLPDYSMALVVTFYNIPNYSTSKYLPILITLRTFCQCH